VQAGYEPFPFDENQYHKVDFVKDPYGPIIVSRDAHPNPGQIKGVLVFQQEGSPAAITETTRILEVFVSGDSCIGLVTLLQKSPIERPMALDILWQILTRGLELSKRNWNLLRVAIVELQNDIYLARMFFGDPETGTVLWDLDCRPSDATFLALRANAPIYIKKSVWDSCSVKLQDSTTYEAVQAALQHHAKTRGSRPAARAEEKLDPEELTAIKLLKRELEVAVSEENYKEATRIRDHPWMRMSSDIELHKSIGYIEEARKLYHALKAQIAAYESQDGEDYESRLIKQRQRDGRSASAFQQEEIKNESKHD